MIFLLYFVLIFYCIFNYNQYIININNLTINNIFWKIVFLLNDSNNNTIIILFIYFCKKLNKNKPIIISLIFLMYMLNIHHINTNQCLFIYDVFLNKELYNGLLIIHPILTYMTIVFYTLLFNNTYNLKIKNLRLKKVFLNVNKLLKISFLALFLGSLWAQQELNWGGWWNWDSIEIILLFFNILILFLIHINKKYINNYIKIFFKKKYFYILLFYIIVRSNIITSVHAFSINLHLQKYFYIYIILLYIYMIIEFFIIKFNKKIFLLNFNFNIFLKNFKNILKSYNFFNFFKNIIIFITIVNIIYFILNIKLSVNVYKYLSILIKIVIVNYFLFLYLNKLNVILFVILTIILNNDYLIFYIITPLIILIKNNSNTKKLHSILLVITFYLLNYFENFLNINSLEYVLTYSNEFINVNEYLLNKTIKLKLDYNILEFNSILLKNNINYFFENILNNFLNLGFFFNFFNSNIININNVLYISYILDNQFIVKVDSYLVLVILNLLICILIFLNLYNNIKPKNGIV